MKRDKRRDAKKKKRSVKLSYSRKLGTAVRFNDGKVMKFDSTSEVSVSLKTLTQLFKNKFGRDPGPNDPIFFDLEKDVPVALSDDQMKRILKNVFVTAGIRPEICYAVEKTGMIMTEDNLHLFSEEDKEEWDNAIDEFESNQFIANEMKEDIKNGS